MAVVREASKGLSDREICEALGIAPGTLGTYWARLRAKTGLRSRVKLATSYARSVVEAESMASLASLARRIAEWRRLGTADGALVTAVLAEVFFDAPLAAFAFHASEGVLAETRRGLVALGLRPDDPQDLAARLTAECRDGLVRAAWGLSLGAGPEQVTLDIRQAARPRDRLAAWLFPVPSAAGLVLVRVHEQEAPGYAVVPGID